MCVPMALHCRSSPAATQCCTISQENRPVRGLTEAAAKAEWLEEGKKLVSIQLRAPHLAAAPVVSSRRPILRTRRQSTPSSPSIRRTAWMLTSTALVLLMVPGLAMFYGGLVRTKNVLGTMMHSFSAMAIIGFLWAAVGYAIAFGPNVLHGFCGWNPAMLFLSDDMRAYPISGGTACIPELVYAMFQGKFAIITPALIAGAFAGARAVSRLLRLHRALGLDRLLPTGTLGLGIRWIPAKDGRAGLRRRNRRPHQRGR